MIATVQNDGTGIIIIVCVFGLACLFTCGLRQRYERAWHRELDRVLGASRRPYNREDE